MCLVTVWHIFVICLVFNKQNDDDDDEIAVEQLIENSGIQLGWQCGGRCMSPLDVASNDRSGTDQSAARQVRDVTFYWASISQRTADSVNKTVQRRQISDSSLQTAVTQCRRRIF